MSAEDEVDRALRPLLTKVDESDIRRARDVVVALLSQLRGTEKERLIQSVLLSYQKLCSSDTKPRVIIAARMASGVPIPVAKLKAALGECWKDGVFTIDDTSDLMKSFELPMSEEGAIAKELGHRALKMVTSLPRE